MPPYSDNLYSGDDEVSDSESFSDELSPSDGYFTRSGMPNNRQLVPDPTIDYGPPEAKTLIDPPHSHPRNGGSSSRLPLIHPRSPPREPLTSSPLYVSPVTSRTQTEYTPVSPISSRTREASFSEHEPLMYQPPPAYSESPPPSSSRTSRSFASYSTFPAQHLEGGFSLARRQPQSMGGPVDGLRNENTPLVGAERFSPRRKRVKALLFAGFVLIVIGSTLSVILACSEGSNENQLDSNAEYCPAANFKKPQTTYEFSSRKELNIIHRTNDDTNNGGYSSVAAEGEIRLRKLPKDSKHGVMPYITVDQGTTTPTIVTTLDWSEDSQTLRLTTPRSSKGYSTKPHCLYIIVTAFFPEDTEVTNLLFDSPSLNLALSDVKVNVTGRSQFSATTGEVWLATSEESEATSSSESKHLALRSKPKSTRQVITTETQMLFFSRRTTVETVSGKITGTYPLFDDLVISSQSGDIDVAVSPQAASRIAPAPADLEVQTASGTIRVELPVNRSTSLPLRDYITRVHSTSGNIFGTYYVGSDNHFKTTSGTIDIVTLPVLPEEKEASKVPPNIFETHTVSGKTKLSVLDPIVFPVSSPSPPSTFDNPYEAIASLRPITNTLKSDSTPSPLMLASSKLRTLRSSHSSNTGEILVKYPDSWQGSVHVKTVSGEIEVKGDGFRTVKERNGWAYREVLKRRGVDGDEGSKVEVGSVSGSVDFEIVA